MKIKHWHKFASYYNFYFKTTTISDIKKLYAQRFLFICIKIFKQHIVDKSDNYFYGKEIDRCNIAKKPDWNWL